MPNNGHHMPHVLRSTRNFLTLPWVHAPFTTTSIPKVTTSHPIHQTNNSDPPLLPSCGKASTVSTTNTKLKNNTQYPPIFKSCLMTNNFLDGINYSTDALLHCGLTTLTTQASTESMSPSSIPNHQPYWELHPWILEHYEHCTSPLTANTTDSPISSTTGLPSLSVYCYIPCPQWLWAHTSPEQILQWPLYVIQQFIDIGVQQVQTHLKAVYTSAIHNTRDICTYFTSIVCKNDNKPPS